MANNGLEALEKIRKVSSMENKPDGQAFDCVLMDLEMPGEFTEAYREIYVSNEHGI